MKPTDDGRTPGTTRILRRLVSRELSTAVARKSYAVLCLGVVVVLLFLAWSGGGIGAGYVSTIIALLTPLELLVPILAMAFGYRAILSDERRGELDVLETYPVTSWQIVLGVYAGRAIGLATTTATALLFVMLGVAVSGTQRSVVYATHTGTDAPGLYLRFVVLTLLFALVLLAVAIAVSALVSTTRTAVAAAGFALVVVLFGADVILLFGLDRGIIAESSLLESLVLSPLSAYRGLVLETSITATSGTGPRAGSPIASVSGLLMWGIGSLAIATAAVRR